MKQPSSARASSDQLATLEPGQVDTSLRRVVIDELRPDIDGGRFPLKRTVGESVVLNAYIFADGHDLIAAVLRDRPASRRERDGEWRETSMSLVGPGTDAWQARFDVGDLGWHEYQVAAWVDRFGTWRRDLDVKAASGEDVSTHLMEGSRLIRAAADRAGDVTNRQWLLERADGLVDDTPIDDRVARALDKELARLMAVHADRSAVTESLTRRVWVDRELARFGAWYEMFPRSAGSRPRGSGTFRDAARALARIADLGFDVVYLPPIHPIGRSFRKGANNALVAGPEDPGSPWAIGSPEGGHTAIEPGLGTHADFDAFRQEAERLGLEIALDLAFQCSPDHPWVRQHPEWFRHRPDGTIKHAENPPKKYQDIYPLDFESEDWRSLWDALLDVARFWIDHGVRIFRVDNPHTKPFRFWEWFIDRIHAEHPGVIFLAEAFTRPRVMRYLAKLGFTQSYTYFTWRNTKQELVDYFTELTTAETREYLRPNLFTNTPDILHAYLQHGGRPAFETRLLLAGTLGASYGIYSGFELCEGRALAPGSEEYADSEKYQIRRRDWNAPGNINELVRRLNMIRREHRALHFDRSLTFQATDNPEIIAYSKTSPDGSDRVFVIVNLDPHHMQHGLVELPVDDDQYGVRDLLDGTRYTWHRGWNYVRFDPEIRQGHVLQLEVTRGPRDS